MLIIVNCKTTPSLQFQEVTDNKERSLLIKKHVGATLVVGSKSSVIKTENIDINKGQTTYINMNEKTFINSLNANSDKLSLIEGIWSNEKKPYKIGIQKAEEKGRYFAFILNSQEPSMKKGEIVAEFFKTRYEYIYSTEYYLEDKTKIVTKGYINENGMLLIFLEKWGKESVAFFRSFPIKEVTEEKVLDLKQSLAREDETGNDENYVQVGAWENHDYAQKLLVKIKTYYPEAYIAAHNNFNKIRIPGILTKKQGVIVSKDIEMKFNLKPILVLKKQ